jgi:tetratricopeptide (TPR) repeat protein
MACRPLTPTLACLGALLVAFPCHAGAPRLGGADRSEPDFWINIAEPGRKQFQVALRRGREAYDAVVNLRGPMRVRRLEEALAAFRQATRHSPQAAEGHYWVGRAAYDLDRMKEAVAAFTVVRRLQPEFGDELGICSKLGIAYSKLGRFEEAVQEYNRADHALGSDASRLGNRSVMHSNAAESLMALGRLDEAIQRYQESVALAQGNILGWWGLAVAFDRDGQASKAREAVDRALALDPTMSKLTDDGVFFVPEGDIHYYFALGYEAKGDPPRARLQWETFLAKLPKNQWAFRARQHLAALSAAPAAPRTRRLAPFPRLPAGASEGDDSLAHDQNSARQRIQGYLYHLRQCYQKELKQQPTLAGHVRLGVTVGKEGRAQEVKVLSSTVKRPSLLACILARVKSITFNRPTTGAAFKISFPMEFKPIVP